MASLGAVLVAVGGIFLIFSVTNFDLCASIFGGWGSSGFDVGRASAGASCSAVTGLISMFSVLILIVGLLLLAYGA